MQIHRVLTGAAAVFAAAVAHDAVFAFAFLLADKYGLDVREIVHDKIAKNRLKYPLEKSKGSAKKYNEL